MSISPFSSIRVFGFQEFHLAFFIQFERLSSGGSRISPRRGRQLPRGGAPTYDFAKISQKLHEIERIWTPRGGRASKILLCRSATAIGIGRSGFPDLFDILGDDVMHFAVCVTNERDEINEKQEGSLVQSTYPFSVVVKKRLSANVIGQSALTNNEL